MRYAVIGGDMRLVHLVSLLRESGRQAEGFLQEGAGGKTLSMKELSHYDCLVSNWPMRWPHACREIMEQDILENIAPGSTFLLCGPKFPQIRRWDLQYINLWEDEALMRENAWLTAEAAVGTAVARTGGSLQGLRCMVVGCGRIGRALMEILLNMGAEVTLVSGSADKRRMAQESGALAVEVGEIASALPEQQLVFSTPPAMVIGPAELEHINKEAWIIDLASPPYGVDLEAAQAYGLKAVRESGLPGRYCPLSAARALMNAILRWEEDEIHED